MVQRAAKFTPEVLLSTPRRSGGLPNSSGTKVLYTTSAYSFETHKKTIELRVLDVDSGESHELAKDDEVSDFNWLDEDAFVCLQAEKDGTTSVYVASVSKIIPGTKYGESHYIAGTIAAGAGNLKAFKLKADGTEYAVVLSAQANPDGSLYTTKQASQQKQSSGRLYSSMFVRHWDQYQTKAKNALWFGTLSRKDKDAKFELSKLTNALRDTGLECPIEPFGGTDNFDINRDAIMFVAKDSKLDPALNTKCNVHILLIDSWTQGHAPEVQTVEVLHFDGAASSPVLDPVGTKAAFLMMQKNGYEADRNHIFVILNIRPSGPTRTEAASTSLSAECASDGTTWDRSPQSIGFSANGRWLLLTAEEVGFARLFSIPVVGPAGPASQSPRRLTTQGYVNGFVPLQDGRIFFFGSSLVCNSTYGIVDPRIKSEGLVAWSHSNTGGGNKLGLSPKQVSSIWTPASNPEINKEVHSIVLRPSNFDNNKKYPVAYLIHGGPQGSWADNWSTRWNAAVFAEQGYIVVAPNPTGSTGYGQAFTDSIRNNWGGDPYQDIVNVWEWVDKNMKEADHDRAVCLGASYGGYMMNWIQGHPLGRKFRALVCHDGIFSTGPTMVATEELYFPFHDLGGTPWYDPGFKAKNQTSAAAQSLRNFGSSTPAEWLKWSPSEHLDKWDTPELVIHSSKDYRLPISEGLAAFHTLQARGVDSQFLTFPDENHWVLKPENGLAWHKVVLNWINKYVGLPLYTEDDPGGEEFWGGVRQENGEVAEMPGQGKPET